MPALLETTARPFGLSLSKPTSALVIASAAKQSRAERVTPPRWIAASLRSSQ
jgi:hypothetical protein